MKMETCDVKGPPMKLCPEAFNRLDDDVYEYRGLVVVCQYDGAKKREMWTCTHTDIYTSRKPSAPTFLDAIRKWLREACTVRDAWMNPEERAQVDHECRRWQQAIMKYEQALYAEQAAARERQRTAARAAACERKRAARAAKAKTKVKVVYAPKDDDTFGGTLTYGQFVKDLTEWLGKPISEWMPHLNAWYEELFGAEYTQAARKPFAAWLARNIPKLSKDVRERHRLHMEWKHAEILRLRDIGVSQQQIAQLLDIPYGSINHVIDKAVQRGVTPSKRRYLDWDALGLRFDELMATDPEFRNASLTVRAKALGITEPALRSHISHRHPGTVGSWTYLPGTGGLWVLTAEFNARGGRLP